MFTNIFISSPSSPHKQQHNKQEEVKESQSSRYLHHVVFVSRMKSEADIGSDVPSDRVVAQYITRAS
ncbi:uncharacterized [Tachysurus ichikawai]